MRCLSSALVLFYSCVVITKSSPLIESKSHSHHHGEIGSHSHSHDTELFREARIESLTEDDATELENDGIKTRGYEAHDKPDFYYHHYHQYPSGYSRYSGSQNTPTDDEFSYERLSFDDVPALSTIDLNGQQILQRLIYGPHQHSSKFTEQFHPWLQNPDNIQTEDIRQTYDISYKLTPNSPFKSYQGEQSPLSPLFSQIVEYDHIRETNPSKYVLISPTNVYKSPESDVFPHNPYPIKKSESGVYDTSETSRAKREAMYTSKDINSQIFPDPFIPEQKYVAEIFDKLEQFESKVSKAIVTSALKTNDIAFIDILRFIILEESQSRVLSAGQALFESAFPVVLLLGTSNEDTESLKNLEDSLIQFSNGIEQVYEVMNSQLGNFFVSDYNDVLGTCLSEILKLCGELTIYLSEKTNSQYLQYRYKF